MKFFLLAVWVIVKTVVLVKTVLSFSRFNNDVDLVMDFVNSYEKPTTVVAIVCWKLQHKHSLMAKCSSLNKPKTIKFIQDNSKAFDFIFKLLLMDAIMVADVSCPNIKDVFKMANKKKLFTNPYRWLIVGKFNNESLVVPRVLENLEILIDSEVITSKQEDDSTYQLHLIYKINFKKEWLIQGFGNWTPTAGLRKSKEMESSMHMRRKNLGREPILTSLPVTDNSTKYNLADLSNPVDSLTKCTFRQNEALYDFINATRVNVFTDTWGYPVNGSWNGMVGNLMRGEAELAGNILFITKSRMEVVHYLSSPLSIDLAFVFRQPPLSYQNNLFLLPFEGTIWYCICGFVLILMIVLYINALWEAKIFANLKTPEYNPKTSMSDVAMVIIGAVTQQGSSIELKGGNGRLVMFMLLLVFLFLYTSYSASVVVLLQSSSNQIRTLSDLLNSNLELGVEEIPYSHFYFENATEPVRKAIYETKIAPQGSKPKFMSMEEGVQRLQKGQFAFHMTLGTGYRVVKKYFKEHEKCGLKEIVYIAENNNPWLSCRKESPYKEIFKMGLYRIREHGMADREMQLIYSKKPTCLSSGGSFTSVSIIDVYPALLMLLYGMILAVVLLVLENLIYHRHKKLSRNK